MAESSPAKAFKREIVRDIVYVGTREVKEQGIKCIISNNITLLPITRDLVGIDALIFTSQNAFKALLDSANPTSPHFNPALSKWHKLPCYVIGESSAKLLAKSSANIAFVGNGNGAEFAHAIVPLLKDKVPLYLRAKDIISHLNSILKASHIALQECVVYENTPLSLDSSLKPKEGAIIIFSAPSAYKSFIANFGWEDSYIAIAIGEATLKSFDKGIRAYKAKNASLKDCITLAKELLGNI